MKSLLIHLSDYHRGGGGGVAMHRLYLGLKRAGVDSKILCGLKTIQSPDISQIPRKPKLERLIKLVTANLGLNDIHLVGSYKIKQLEVYKQADILDFHGTHSNTLSYLALPRLTEDKPAVFTLHDMWALTGHCAYSYDCERWKTGCGQCPYPDEHPKIRRDGTAIEWKLKNWVYNRSNLSIVAVSRWLTDLAKQSILQNFPIYYIPNGIDTNIYKPLDPEQCRFLLGLPSDKKVLMFGALSLQNHRKGGDLLLKALQNLPNALKRDLVILTIGNGGEVITQALDMQHVNVGFVSSDHLKAICYSAADLFIHPTRADNLPLVLLESMASGTPMLSFDVGGVPELVRPGVTGYLAEAENVQDLCQGIVELLEDEPQRRKMEWECRELALQEYALELQIQRYLTLYDGLIENNPINLEQKHHSNSHLVLSET